jgi:hypothetical protein
MKVLNVLNSFVGVLAASLDSTQHTTKGRLKFFGRPAAAKKKFA